MPADAKAPGVKSAYEAALERLDAQGIDRPDAGSLDTATKDRIAEVRRKAEGRLAEVEILHADRLRKVTTLEERDQAEENYLRDRQRITGDRDREIDKVRGA